MSLRGAVALAIVFVVGLVVFEFLLLPPKSSIVVFVRHWEQGDALRIVAISAISGVSILLTFAFAVAAATSTTFYRLLYFLVFSVLLALEYLVFKAYYRFSQLRDVATTMIGVDVGMSIEAVAAYANWLALIPIAVFAGILLVTRKVKQNGGFVFAGLTAISVLVFAGSSYFTKNRHYAPSLANAVRSVVSYPTGWYLGSVDGAPEGLAYAAPRASLTYRAQSAPANNVVFIVDESIRGDRLSVNGYARQTTPLLDRLKQDGSLATWGVAAAWTTCSHTSNPLLLTGLNQLPDETFNVHRWPTIFQYARAMGYKNHYFDAYTNVVWNGKDSDRGDYGNWVTESELSRGLTYRYEMDAVIGRRVREIVSQSKGNFVWVHTYGVHTPYINAFPNENYGQILDQMSTDYDPDLQEQAIGELYDRAISYSINSFFSNLLEDGLSADTTYVYTSDHGQTLRENGSTVSHCADSRPEAIVPILMIDQPTRLANLDTSFRPSHANVFATLLDLLAYPESERQFPYALSLLKAREADSIPRFYYSDEIRTAKRHAFDNVE